MKALLAVNYAIEVDWVWVVVMDDKLSLLAMIFYLSGGVIRGVTRLHKIVFLVGEELGLGGFDFKPYRYGPWSPQLEELVNSLVSKGLIAVDEESNIAYSLVGEKPAKILIASKSLVEIGEKEFQRLRERDPAKAYALKKKVVAYTLTPITYLIAYIYAKYPQFAVNTVIGEKVEKWRKFYGLR